MHETLSLIVSGFGLAAAFVAFWAVVVRAPKGDYPLPSEEDERNAW
jgi:hypothetical protein